MCKLFDVVLITSSTQPGSIEKATLERSFVATLPYLKPFTLGTG